MVHVKKSIGVLVACLLMLGCLVIAPLMRPDTASADTGLQADTTSLQTQASKAPKKKLTKKKLYASSTTIYYTWNQGSPWYSQSNKKTGYQVQWSTNKNFSNGKTLSTYYKTYTGFRVPNAKPGKTYYFRVRMFNKIGGKQYNGPWSNTSSITISKYTPSQKLSLKLSAGEKSITAKYTKANEWITNGGGSDAKVSGYEIWWTKRSDTNWDYKHVKYVKNRDTTEVKLKSLTAGSQYMVAVRLYNTVRGATYYGPWSAVKTATPTSGSSFG